MPFKSRAQLRYLFAKHPELAKEWLERYGVSPNLPKYAKTKSAKRRRTKKRRKRS